MKTRLSAALVVLALEGCGGSGGCPDIYIPIYDVNVYDSVTGELICQDGFTPTPDKCEITYDFSQNGRSADITAQAPGYQSKALKAVENQTWRSGCWDNPNYTTPR